MGFPSPATDYIEKRLSLDALCNTQTPSVYLFKSGTESATAGIKKGALLVVNSDSKPVDGSIIAARIDGQFRLVRYRTAPFFHLEDLSSPTRRIPITDDEVTSDEGGICFGVVTHILNDVRVKQ